MSSLPPPTSENIKQPPKETYFLSLSLSPSNPPPSPFFSSCKSLELNPSSAWFVGQKYTLHVLGCPQKCTSTTISFSIYILLTCWVPSRWAPGKSLVAHPMPSGRGEQPFLLLAPPSCSTSLKGHSKKNIS